MNENNKEIKINNNPFLIKLDIDGTITDGHIVCLSTGRNFLSAMIIYKEAKLNSYLSCYNGSDDLEIFTTSEDDHYKTLFLRNHEYNKLSSIEEGIKTLSDSNVICFIIEFKNESSLINNKNNKGVFIVDDDRLTIRIRNKNADKAKGAEIIASHYNIPFERIIAFGNETNDIEIISSVGYGIVTYDSSIYLKSIAYDVIDNTHKLNSDGVANFLMNFFGYKSLE
uniref:Haloacid dehalogenase-like hydrolase n=1 Tax=Meloidogyne floridensis TaxID=298350 RepID=A0A915NGF6_9BILA